MEQEETRGKDTKGFVVRMLNASGKAMVKTYDITSSLFMKTANTVKSVTPDATVKTKRFFEDGFKKLSISGEWTKDLFISGYKKLIKPGEKKELESKIEEYGEKIKNLYLEIGKKGASTEKPEADDVQKLIGEVREFEQEIQRLRSRMTELDDLQREEDFKQTEAKKEVKPPKKKLKVSGEQTVNALKLAIEKALKQGEFDSDSEKAIFGKIANDLLDVEMEIKILAATELGKMGIKAAVAVLLEAVAFDNPYLNVEIINSLINIGAPQALNLCKEMANGANQRLRICSLRGLYKMGSDEEIIPYFLNALKDEHPEVRRSAATFLGWKNIQDSVPGLIQSLQDKDETVRNAAVSALSNIRDTSSVLPLIRALSDDNMEIKQKALETIRVVTNSDVSFNVELVGEELSQAIENLKKWWHEERMRKVDTTVAEEAFVTEHESNIGKFTAKTTGSAVEQHDEDFVSVGSVTETVESTDRTTDSSAEQINEDSLSDGNVEFTEPATVSTVETQEAPDTESNEEDTGQDTEEDVEEATGTDFTDTIPSLKKLKKMSKEEIIAICKSRGFECDITNTRAELINLLHP
ncbi:MAG: HEAT repeat domain-containing protein [Nitrospirae bacterium]|nr:HEAT repeat domain-containing protein [Nitrospirota bacterium]